MSDNQPSAITAAELRQIAELQELHEQWGAENADEMLENLKGDYIVKFDFMNESPGYVGDLFLIQPGFLSDEIPVVRLYRDKDGKLNVLSSRK